VGPSDLGFLLNVIAALIKRNELAMPSHTPESTMESSSITDLSNSEKSLPYGTLKRIIHNT
jgi:hypothetical protein